MTQPFEPYRPADDDLHAGYDDDLDWADEQEGYPERPNVLWGRVALLGGMLLLAFLFGRMTKGGGGIPEERLTRAEARVENLQAENEELAAQLAAAQTELTEAAAAAGDDEGAAATDASDDDAEAAASTDVTYTVAPRETLTIIAQKCYGDAALDDYIAEANAIADPTQLAVGQELTIPAHPDVDQIACG